MRCQGRNHQEPCWQLSQNCFWMEAEGCYCLALERGGAEAIIPFARGARRPSRSRAAI